MGSDQSPRGPTSDDRVAMSDVSFTVFASKSSLMMTLMQSEATHHDAKSRRRRLFGRSAESASLKEKAGSIKDSSSRHSKEVTPTTPNDGPAENAEDLPRRRPSKKRSSGDRGASDRLSLFGGTFSGTLAKARKPVPRLHSSS